MLILLIIAINDFLFFRIENEYVFALVLLYIFSCVIGISGHNIWQGVISASVAFVICFLLNQKGLLGGGDVKLIVPLLFFAENNPVSFITGMSIGGFFLGTIYIFYFRSIFFLRRRLVLSLYVLKKSCGNSVLLNFVLLSLSRISRKSVALSRYRRDALKQEIPYGIALACGGFSLVLDLCGW